MLACSLTMMITRDGNGAPEYFQDREYEMATAVVGAKQTDLKLDYHDNRGFILASIFPTKIVGMYEIEVMNRVVKTVDSLPTALDVRTSHAIKLGKPEIGKGIKLDIPGAEWKRRSRVVCEFVDARGPEFNVLDKVKASDINQRDLSPKANAPK